MSRINIKKVSAHINDEVPTFNVGGLLFEAKDIDQAQRSFFRLKSSSTPHRTKGHVRIDGRRIYFTGKK